MAVFDELQIVDAGLTFADCRPWVREFAEAIFGSYCDVPGHPDEGRRLIKTFFMLISKKNTKSTIAAGIMLTVLIQNWRPEAEFLILSPTKEIADNSFKPIKAAIEADEELRDLFHIQPHMRQITHRGTKATLKVVAADSQTVSGKKATGVLVDELHEFGKVAKAEDMLVEGTGGLMSRPEGFVIYLTTQSSEPPAGVFKKELEYARKVRDGKVDDPTYFPIIYEFPDEYLDPKMRPYLREENWYITNPNLGASVDLDTLRQKLTKAGETGEDSLQSVVSKHLNIQIGLDLGADRWPGADYWLGAAHDSARSLDDLLGACEVVTCGIDGGGLDDLLAVTFTGRVSGTLDHYLSWSHAWVARKLLTTRTEIADRLTDFEKDGDLTIVETVGDDAKQMAAMVKRVNDTDLLAGIGIDPAKIAALQAALVAEGVIAAEEPDPKFWIKVRQGWSLYGAMLNVERSLAEGRYKHCAQPLVDWCVGNGKVVQRGNAMLVTKEVSGKAKIDPLMSSFNAMELMSYNPPARTGGYSLDNLTLMG
jgi:phage terminase large subunit-like protein